MHIKQVLEQIDYRFSSGGDYLWKCFGDNAAYLDFKTITGKPVGSIVYDSETAQVYEINVEVPDEQLAYRWMDISARENHQMESTRRGFGTDNAWDDTFYIDIDVETDFLEKLGAIIREEEVDQSITVSIDLSESEELQLYRLAHKADMTMNEYVCQILEKEIAERKSSKYQDRYGW